MKNPGWPTCPRSIGFAVVIITFIAAGAIEVFENDFSQFPDYVPPARLDGLTFLDCQYFVMVTLATIGSVPAAVDMPALPSPACSVLSTPRDVLGHHGVGLVAEPSGCWHPRLVSAVA